MSVYDTCRHENAASLFGRRHPAGPRPGPALWLRHHRSHRADERDRVSHARQARGCRIRVLGLGSARDGAQEQAAAATLLRAARRRQARAPREPRAVPHAPRPVTPGAEEGGRPMTPRHPRLVALLAVLSRFCPPWQRDEWLREWSAEVEHSASVRVISLTIGAVVHLFWLQRRRWQLDSLGADARHGLRGLLRRPAFTLTAIGTLAVGSAATTTLATIVTGVLLKPLPFPEPDRLVRLSETREGATGSRHPVLVRDTLLAWRGRSTTLTALAGYITAPATVRADANQIGDRVVVAGMTAELFDTLGVRPALGAGPALTARSADRAVWLSDQAWRRYYQGNAAALGRPLWMDGEPYTIAGVMPPGFAFPGQDTMAWSVTDDIKFFDAIARLRPGVTPAQ